jgi:CheY-like chemotaxis protein
MAKILLVEDDNNLREIYEARLQAEGYDIVSAMDGEEALVVAKKEKPDLVISDVMMPRISGFEMLDILRNTEGLQDVKVIMLTALGQAEDKTRADSLGADRYLVKSQVTLEDIVKAAQELLGPADGSAAAAAGAAAAAPTPQPEPAQPPVAPVSPAPAPEPSPAPVTPQIPAQPSVTPTPSPAVPVTPAPSMPAPPEPPVTPSPVAPQPSTPAPEPTVPAAPSAPTVPTPGPAPAPAPTAPSAPADPTPSVPAIPEPPVTPSEPSTPPAVPGPTEQPQTPMPAAPTEQPQPALPPSPGEPLTAPMQPAPGTEATPDESASSDTQPAPAQTPAPAKPPAEAEAATTSEAQSTSAEEDTIKAQIESFVSQNNQTAPGAAPVEEPQADKPAEKEPEPTPPNNNDFMADAIKGLVAEAETDQGPKPQSLVGEKTVQPPSEADKNAATMPAPDVVAPSGDQNQTEQQQPQTDNTDTAEDDSVGVAHKKIISPITDSGEAPRSDLNDLLAKEGFGGMDEMHQENYGTPTPQNPTGLPTAPHPPGHVISPNPNQPGQGGVDPNSIAL